MLGTSPQHGPREIRLSYAARTKYDEPGRAARYAARSARRDAQEWALVARLLDALPQPPSDALDVPCGTGRIAARLLERGVPTRCADLSAAMRAATEARLAGTPGYGGVAPLDLEALPEPPPAPADLVVCLRFLHHLPDEAHRGHVLASLRDLTRGHLLLSFHHPVSWHNLKRVFRRLVTRRRGDRHALAPRALRAEARAAGFELLTLAGLAPYRRDFWVALLRPFAEAPAPMTRE